MTVQSLAAIRADLLPDASLSAVLRNDQCFANLGKPKRIWTIGAIHGSVLSLVRLHDDIASRFQPGDRLVYLGNFLGHGTTVRETVDELIAFRRFLMSMRGVLVSDLVYLRGAQEEMWQKMLQLQLAPNPTPVFQWMLNHGADATLKAYGGNVQEAQAIMRHGAVHISRWTAGLKNAMRSCGGHLDLMNSLRWAALSPTGSIILTSAGLNPLLPLDKQGDRFWWPSRRFDRQDNAPSEAMRRVVRGWNPERPNVQVTDWTLTLDSNARQGGAIAAACLTPNGEILDVFEA